MTRADYRFSVTLCLCLCVLLMSAPRAYAQAVTVEELVTIALEKAPSLQAARTEIAAASGRIAGSFHPDRVVFGVGSEGFAPARIDRIASKCAHGPGGDHHACFRGTGGAPTPRLSPLLYASAPGPCNRFPDKWPPGDRLIFRGFPRGRP